MSNARPLFGWSTFTNFKKDTPIIVTEGSKDCIILQKYYPYVLALLTAGVTVANANILRTMTNKVILAYDRDSTGLKETKKDIEKLQNAGIQVLMLKSHKKDFGADYQNSEYLKKEIEQRLKNFSKFGVLL
jgi:DNA primase